MSEDSIDEKAVVEALNRILEIELAGVVRYLHYSFMVYGYNRIPIVSWLRGQASESMLHAQEAGELITHAAWCAFLFPLVATLAMLFTELNLPEPAPASRGAETPTPPG